MSIHTGKKSIIQCNPSPHTPHKQWQLDSKVAQASSAYTPSHSCTGFCREPARESPPITRLCGKVLVGKVCQNSRGAPLGLPERLPQNQSLPTLLLCSCTASEAQLWFRPHLCVGASLQHLLWRLPQNALTCPGGWGWNGISRAQPTGTGVVTHWSSQAPLNNLDTEHAVCFHYSIKKQQVLSAPG